MCCSLARPSSSSHIHHSLPKFPPEICFQSFHSPPLSVLLLTASTNLLTQIKDRFALPRTGIDIKHKQRRTLYDREEMKVRSTRTAFPNPSLFSFQPPLHSLKNRCMKCNEYDKLKSKRPHGYQSECRPKCRPNKTGRRISKQKSQGPKPRTEK